MQIGSTSKFDSNSQIRPSSPYSATKACGDLLALAWARSFSLKATVSNSCNNFGATQNPEKLIPNIVSRLANGGAPQLYGDGLNVREWIHVSDHSRAIEAILARGQIGRRYLIGTGILRSNLQVANSILSSLGLSEVSISFTGDRPGHDLQYAVDWQATQEDTGWVPLEVDFESKLDEVVKLIFNSIVQP
jgi:dTDP-glucose 4,6-dehydratase